MLRAAGILRPVDANHCIDWRTLAPTAARSSLPPLWLSRGE